MMLDSGGSVCLLRFCIPVPILAPPQQQPPPVPWHPGFLSVFLLSISSLGSVSPSRLSLSHHCLSTFPGSPSLQLPLLPPLGWLPFIPS